jgi:hypothetical protein
LSQTARRILMRSPRDPFEVVTPEATFDDNLIATNSGNLLFLDAAWKALSAPGVQITSAGMRARPGAAEAINEQYDVFVIPLANAFRQTYLWHLRRLTRLIRRLRIPVVVLGVGAQASLDGGRYEFEDVAADVKAFAAAVLDHSPSIGVRGEVTQAYLAGLGFRDVEIIGCPSMFMYGSNLQVARPGATLPRNARIALTASPDVPSIERIVDRAQAAYPNLRYIAQDLDTLGLMLLGRHAPAASGPSDAPIPPSHPLFARNRTRFYVDPWTWIDDLRGYEFCYGTRIHGAVASILAGVPTFLLAHDSRTLELAEYFRIPFRRIDAVEGDVDPADLYPLADPSELNAVLPERFAAFTAFLARHDLDHIFAHEGAAQAFDARVASTRWPPAVTAAGPRSPMGLYRRWRWRRDRERAEQVRQRQAERRTDRRQARKQARRQAGPAPEERTPSAPTGVDPGSG